MDMGIVMEVRKMNMAGRGGRGKEHGQVRNRHIDNYEGQKVIAYVRVFLRSEKKSLYFYVCLWMLGEWLPIHEGFSSYACIPVKDGG